MVELQAIAEFLRNILVRKPLIPQLRMGVAQIQIEPPPAVVVDHQRMGPFWDSYAAIISSTHAAWSCHCGIGSWWAGTAAGVVLMALLMACSPNTEPQTNTGNPIGTLPLGVTAP